MFGDREKDGAREGKGTTRVKKAMQRVYVTEEDA